MSDDNFEGFLVNGQGQAPERTSGVAPGSVWDLAIQGKLGSGNEVAANSFNDDLAGELAALGFLSAVAPQARPSSASGAVEHGGNLERNA